MSASVRSKDGSEWAVFMEESMEASEEQSFPRSTAQDAVVAHSLYRPDIDGLRAFAAVGVIGAHTGILPGGFIGPWRPPNFPHPWPVGTPPP